MTFHHFKREQFLYGSTSVDTGPGGAGRGLIVGSDLCPGKAEDEEGFKNGDGQMHPGNGPLKTISCDDACGCMIRSLGKEDVMSVTKWHLKKVHKTDGTERQMNEMMKTDGSSQLHT